MGVGLWARFVCTSARPHSSTARRDGGGPTGGIRGSADELPGVENIKMSSDCRDAVRDARKVLLF
jgi:hypothetical protein